jgi:hypothetical protein
VNSLYYGDNLRALQRYVANVGISGSSLRNQGAPGVIAAARAFLAEVELTALRDIELPDYQAWLEQETSALLLRLPESAKKWGAARKAINIFTTQAFLNCGLATAFGLARLGDVMETPLDSVAAQKLQKLRQMAGTSRLPSWPGVGRLMPDVSRDYQNFALEVAREKGLPRACLDIILWRPLE